MEIINPRASDGALAAGQNFFLPLIIMFRPLEKEFNFLIKQNHYR